MDQTLMNGSAVILAGGASRRMGQDKAEMAWDDQTLLEHAVGIMRPLFEDILVVSGATPRNVRGARSVQDKKIGVGPLAGLMAGLESALHPWAFVTACDMPFLNGHLVRGLWSLAGGHCQAVIPWAGDRPQPLCGCYHRSALVPAEVCLQVGERSLQGFLALLRVRWVQESEMHPWGIDLNSFTNMNTPEEYTQALGRVAHG